MGKVALAYNLLVRIIKFGPTIALGNIAINHCKPFLSEKMINTFSDYRNRKIQKRLEPLVDAVLLEEKISSPDGKNPDIIWFCWLQGEENMPSIPSLCYEYLKKNSGTHPVQLLTWDNLSEFVDIEPIVLEKFQRGLIKPCHFADILRICILAQKGGVWMDATLLCVAPIEERFFNREFFTIKLPPFGNFISKCRWAVYCLSARQGNRMFILLEKLFKRYVVENDYFIDYFLFDHFIDILYRKDSNIAALIDSVEVTNPNIMELNSILLNEYDERVFEGLTKDTSIFKLNWKTFTDKNEKLGFETFYQHFKAII